MSEEKKELTLEEAVARINELEEQLTPKPKVMTDQEREQRSKEVAFFQEAQRGAYFIKFMMDHLRMGGYNRQTQRRLIRQMMNKQFSKEFIDMGIANVKEMIEYIENHIKKDAELKKTLEPKNEEPLVDGAEYLEDLKKQEAEGTLQDND